MTDGRLRAAPSRPAALAIIAIGLIAAASCGHAPDTGNIELVVAIPDGVTIARVEYSIMHAGEATRTGSIDGPAMSTFSRLVTHVPVGTGYTVHASALTADGQTTCDGMGEADVKSHATTLVYVALTCHGGSGGHVLVTIKVQQQCPTFAVTSYSVSPLSASVGGDIDVSAMTSASDGGIVSFSWTAPSGTFADPTAAHTTYMCGRAGPIALQVTASLDACFDSKAITVSCGADAGAPP
jgi:hypothetical protein